MNTAININKQKETANVQRETVACPVCNGESFVALFEKNNEPFVRCTDCGLVLINPRPIYAQLLDTYDDNYSQIYAKKTDKKIKRIKRWVNRVIKIRGNNGTWLDLGCSVGFVVKTAQEFGFEAYGIDVQPWGIEYGKNKLGLQNLSCGLLENQNYQDNFFDVISLYDVIEHIPDLNSLVAELKRMLSKDGIIDIVTPDIGHWRTPKKLHTWNEIKPSEHLYYFSLKTLTMLLKKHGLKIVKKRFHWKSSLRIYVEHA